MRTLALAVLLALAACAPASEDVAAAICERQGFTRGTPAFASCFGPTFSGITTRRAILAAAP